MIKTKYEGIKGLVSNQNKIILGFGVCFPDNQMSLDMSLLTVRVCLIDPNYVDAPNPKLKYGFILHNKDLPAMEVSDPKKKASLDILTANNMRRVIIAQEFKTIDFTQGIAMKDDGQFVFKNVPGEELGPILA